MKASLTLTGTIAAPLLAELNKNDLWKIVGRRIHRIKEFGMFEIRLEHLILQITVEHEDKLLRLIVLTEDEDKRLEGAKLSLVLADNFKHIDLEGKLVKTLFSTGDPSLNELEIFSCEHPQRGKGNVSVLTLNVPLATVEFPVTNDANYNFHDDIEPLLSRKHWKKSAGSKK